MVTILVVDDHPDVVRLVRAALGRRYDVVGAASGEDALAMVADCRPSLVLLDVKLPALGGFQVLHRLRLDPATADLPVVMLTVLDKEQDVVLGLRLGADAYLAKPFHPRDLAILVSRQLEMADATDADRELSLVT